MDNTEAREIFDAVRAKALDEGDADGAARAELLREYFCNPDFREKLRKFSWDATKGDPAQHRGHPGHPVTCLRRCCEVAK
jgi:hypothetical protein